MRIVPSSRAMGQGDALLFRAIPAGTCGLCRCRGCPGHPAPVQVRCPWAGDHCRLQGTAALGVHRRGMVKALEADKSHRPAAVLPRFSAVSWKWIWCPLDFNSLQKGHLITGYDKLQRGAERSIRRNSQWNQGRGGKRSRCWEDGAEMPSSDRC